MGFTADANRSQPSDNGTLSDFAPEEGFEADNLFTAGFGASWEIDVFGRIRRQVEAADATTQASVEAYRDVLVSLYAETALAYVNVRASQERLRIANANVEAQENTLQLTKDRFDSGLVSALDVAQAESNLANTYSLIPVIERDINEGLNRLAVLLGEYPGALHAELDDEVPIPHEPEAVAMGLPDRAAPPTSGCPPGRAAARLPDCADRSRDGGPLPDIFSGGVPGSGGAECW